MANHYVRRVKLVALSILVCMATISIPTHATSPECEKLLAWYEINGINNYSPPTICDDVCDSYSTTIAIGGDKLPNETTTFLDSSVAGSISDTQKQVYTDAEVATGIPWQAIAALHYREAEMDPSKSVINGSSLGSGIDSESGVAISNNATTDAINAADLLISLARDVYGIDLVDAKTKSISMKDWGLSFLAYGSGQVYKEKGKNYSDSAYVVNGIDSNHIGMSWQDIDSPQTGVDSKKAGALSVYWYLGGPLGKIDTTSDCVGSGIASGNIVKTATGLAVNHPVADGTIDIPDNTSNPKQHADYLRYQDFLTAKNQYKDTAGVTDCGGFVSLVIRSSGADTDFPISGSAIILDYVKNSSKYTEVTYDSLRPGDILLSDNGAAGKDYSGHVMLYLGPVTGDDGTQYVAADASLDQRIPSLRSNSGVVWMHTDSTRVNSSAWRLNG